MEVIAFENVVCKIAAILSQPQYVNKNALKILVYQNHILLMHGKLRVVIMPTLSSLMVASENKVGIMMTLSFEFGIDELSIMCVMRIFVSSQWEMELQCNAISHWLGVYTEWSLHLAYEMSFIYNLSCWRRLSFRKSLNEVYVNARSMFGPS